MKLLQAINPMTWVNKAIDKRIQHYGKGAATEMKYNPLLHDMSTTNYDDKQMTRRVLENSLWYSGDEQALAYFYQRVAPKFYRYGQSSESTNYFWADSENKFRKIHSGFPQLICEKMVDLIVGNGYNIYVEGEQEEEYQEVLDELLKENKIKQLLAKAIETESWSGGVAWKITFNPTVSEYPIIESWQPENYTCTVVAGRIVEDIFFVYYEKNNTKYRLSEIYGKDNKGAYIDYKLDMLVHNTKNQDDDTKWVDVPLTELEQTAELERIEFIGYPHKLALYKPNKLPNSEFRYSIHGESDYSGSYGAFDAIDEIISTWIQEFRDGKLNRYFPEELVPKDKKGNSNVPSSFEKDHIMYADSPSENMDKQRIIYEQGEIRTEKHIESYKIWVTQVLNNAGLSPLTVGITGLESIDASAESQQEREKVSIRTRNKKIETWEEFLQDIIKTALQLHIMLKDSIKNDEKTYVISSVPEFDLIVSFEDYIVKSKRDRTQEVAEGMGTSWDITEGVRYVHDDMTDKEQLTLSGRIKLQSGLYDSITQAEASAINDSNLRDNEMLVENDVQIIDLTDNAGNNQENTDGVVTQENDIEPPAEE